MIFRKAITSKNSSLSWSTPLSGHFLFHAPQRYNLHRKSLVSRVHYVHHGCIFVAIVPRAGWNHSRIEPHHMRTWTQCKIRKEKNRHSHWKMHRVNDVFQIWLCSQVTHTLTRDACISSSCAPTFCITPFVPRRRRCVAPLMRFNFANKMALVLHTLLVTPTVGGRVCVCVLCYVARFVDWWGVFWVWRWKQKGFKLRYVKFFSTLAAIDELRKWGLSCELRLNEIDLKKLFCDTNSKIEMHP